MVGYIKMINNNFIGTVGLFVACRSLLVVKQKLYMIKKNSIFLVGITSFLCGFLNVIKY